MKSKRKTRMRNRGPVDPLPSEPVDGVLLVGVETVEFETHTIPRVGCDVTSFAPALHNGQHCWLRTDHWDPAPGYTASGIQDSLVTAQEGREIVTKAGFLAFVRKAEAFWARKEEK